MIYGIHTKSQAYSHSNILGIDSVMDTSYPDDNKVLLVIADGNITGKGERCSTPETLAKILGYTMNPNDKVYKCKSIGELTENRAKLQYGKYDHALVLQCQYCADVAHPMSMFPYCRHLQGRWKGVEVYGHSKNWLAK